MNKYYWSVKCVYSINSFIVESYYGHFDSYKEAMKEYYKELNFRKNIADTSTIVVGPVRRKEYYRLGRGEQDGP